MTVIGGIALFIAGAAVGGGAITCNHACVRKAERRAQKECSQLRVELGKMRTTERNSESYWNGYADGRKDCKADLEQMLQTSEAQRTARARKGA